MDVGPGNGSFWIVPVLMQAPEIVDVEIEMHAAGEGAVLINRTLAVLEKWAWRPARKIAAVMRNALLERLSDCANMVADVLCFEIGNRHVHMAAMAAASCTGCELPGMSKNLVGGVQHFLKLDGRSGIHLRNALGQRLDALFELRRNGAEKAVEILRCQLTSLLRRYIQGYGDVHDVADNAMSWRSFIMAEPSPIARPALAMPSRRLAASPAI